MDGSEGSSLSFVEEEESSACSNRTGIDVSVPNISTRFDVDGRDGVDSVFIVFDSRVLPTYGNIFYSMSNIRLHLCSLILGMIVLKSSCLFFLVQDTTFEMLFERLPMPFLCCSKDHYYAKAQESRGHCGV